MSQSEGLERLVGSAWLRSAGVICVVAIAIVSLMPGESQARTGLPGPFEHFMAYCISSAVITMGARSGRFPGTIIVTLVLFSGLMEATVLSHFHTDYANTTRANLVKFQENASQICLKQSRPRAGRLRGGFKSGLPAVRLWGRGRPVS